MLILGEILQPFEKKTALHCYFGCYLSCDRVPLQYCYPEFGKYLVRDLEQTDFQSPQLGFRPRVVYFVCNDGYCRGNCLGQRILSSLGQNSFVPFCIPVATECHLEYCFLWVSGTFLGINCDYYSYYSYCSNDSLVQGR